MSAHSTCAQFKDAIQLMLDHGSNVTIKNSAGKTAAEEVHTRNEVWGGAGSVWGGVGSVWGGAGSVWGGAGSVWGGAGSVWGGVPAWPSL